MTPFDFVNSVSHNKQDLFKEDISESDYVPFVVNKSLSYFADTILYANEMNKVGVDNKLQYHYLLNTIRPAKRFAKWVKRENIEDVAAVKQFYGYSTEKATQALTILSSDNLHYIKQKLQRGEDNDQTRIASRGETQD
jgi:Bacteriophage clamp loader A subunit